MKNAEYLRKETLLIYLKLWVVRMKIFFQLCFADYTLKYESKLSLFLHVRNRIMYYINRY